MRTLAGCETVMAGDRGVLPLAIQHVRERRVFFWDDSRGVYVSDDLARDVAPPAMVLAAWGRLWRPAPSRPRQGDLLASAGGRSFSDYWIRTRGSVPGMRRRA